MGPQFFIRRPRFALVNSLLITIFGIMAALVMPLDPYPDKSAPKVVVRANYPGASAETVKEAVAGPIEDVEVDRVRAKTLGVSVSDIFRWGW
jgi:HAE1 family hydrophobic/amphiphilic exporter-1